MSRTILHLLTALATLFALAACDGQLGLEPRAGHAPPPRLMPQPDAGLGSSDASLVSSDAYWSPPDAFTPPSCMPSCAGRACGSNGCGGSCGSCGAGATCNASQQCESTPPTGGTHAVTLYGTSSCGYCRQARTFFGANHVTFSDRDLEAPGVIDEAFERVHELTGEYRVATPTIIIDDEVMLGWSEAACRERLGL